MPVRSRCRRTRSPCRPNAAHRGRGRIPDPIDVLVDGRGLSAGKVVLLAEVLRKHAFGELRVIPGYVVALSPGCGLVSVPGETFLTLFPPPSPTLAALVRKSRARPEKVNNVSPGTVNDFY